MLQIWKYPRSVVSNWAVEPYNCFPCVLAIKFGRLLSLCIFGCFLFLVGFWGFLITVLRILSNVLSFMDSYSPINISGLVKKLISSGARFDNWGLKFQVSVHLNTKYFSPLTFKCPASFRLEWKIKYVQISVQGYHKSVWHGDHKEDVQFNPRKTSAVDLLQYHESVYSRYMNF